MNLAAALALLADNTTRDITEADMRAIVTELYGRAAPVIPFGINEARPLIASGAYSDLEVWSWTDDKVPAFEGDTNLTDLTREAYRDTGHIEGFMRHDQSNLLCFKHQMDHFWAGTAVRYHVHAIPMASGSGDIYWTLRYHFGNAGAVLPELAQWGSAAVASPVVPGDLYLRRIVSLATIAAPAVPGHSDILSVSLRRDGTSLLDTYTASKDHGTAQANVCAESVDLHYQRLAVGSEELFTGALAVNPSRILFDKASHPSDAAIYLRLIVKADAGNICAWRLYDVTGAAPVASSEVTTTSTAYVALDAGPLTLGAGLREYRIQARHDATPDEPKLASAAFVIR